MNAAATDQQDGQDGADPSSSGAGVRRGGAVMTPIP
jgi:hypothetical protein